MLIGDTRGDAERKKFYKLASPMSIKTNKTSRDIHKNPSKNHVIVLHDNLPNYEAISV